MPDVVDNVSWGADVDEPEAAAVVGVGVSGALGEASDVASSLSSVPDVDTLAGSSLSSLGSLANSGLTAGDSLFSSVDASDGESISMLESALPTSSLLTSIVVSSIAVSAVVFSVSLVPSALALSAASSLAGCSSVTTSSTDFSIQGSLITVSGSWEEGSFVSIESLRSNDGWSELVAASMLCFAPASSFSLCAFLANFLARRPSFDRPSPPDSGSELEGGLDRDEFESTLCLLFRFLGAALVVDPSWSPVALLISLVSSCFSGRFGKEAVSGNLVLNP